MNDTNTPADLAPTDAELIAAINRGIAAGTLVVLDDAFLARLAAPTAAELADQDAARVAVAYRCDTCGEGVATDGTCGPYCPEGELVDVTP